MENEVLNIIRSIRINKGISQEYMAEKLGLTQVSYSLLESGKRKLTVNRLFEICQIIDISMIELLTKTKKNYNGSIISNNDRDNEILKNTINDKNKIIKLLEEKIKQYEKY